MRPAEVEYWDKVCRECFGEGGVSDNWMKRMAMMAFLAKYSWFKKRVLEIGTGNGVSASMLRMGVGGLWDYVGTDLSSEFCKTGEKFGLKMVQADILSLPEGKFDRVIALDTLEHVDPEDRPAGYDGIVERMADDALLFINIPLSESQHTNEFDHGFGLGDLHQLETRGLTLQRYETYACIYAGQARHYAMAVLCK